MFLFDNDYFNLVALVLTIGAAAIICFKYETRDFEKKSNKNIDIPTPYKINSKK